MGTGIILCGLNGAGKSTLGRALAKDLGSHFIDIEDLYFPKTDPHYIYSSPRTRIEVQEMLLNTAKSHENLVIACVKGDYGDAIAPFFQYAVLLEVPKDIRMQRVKSRSFEKFGDRILPGGDLYEPERAFLELVGSRAEDTAEEWLKTFTGMILRVDGTRPIEENVRLIAEQIRGIHTLRLYKPSQDELWFRQELLADPDTMSYNAKWGGTISFPEERWRDWYGRWVIQNGSKRFYRYLLDADTNNFVGEAAYHYDDARGIFLCDIIVHAKYRGNGYGTEGLRLLCEAAKDNGIVALYDDIAADNPSVTLFLSNGFMVAYQTDEAVTVKRVL